MMSCFLWAWARMLGSPTRETRVNSKMRTQVREAVATIMKQTDVSFHLQLILTWSKKKQLMIKTSALKATRSTLRRLRHHERSGMEEIVSIIVWTSQSSGKTMTSAKQTIKAPLSRPRVLEILLLNPRAAQKQMDLQTQQISRPIAATKQYKTPFQAQSWSKA